MAKLFQLITVVSMDGIGAVEMDSCTCTDMLL